MKKKILVYAHYFYPDVASTGQILTELCEGLEEDFEIVVICAVPSYSGTVNDRYKDKRLYLESHGNIKVLRVRVCDFDKTNKISRIKNILGYFFNAIFATFKIKDVDIVYSISQPPILGGTLGVIGKVLKRAKYVYNIQDFNPEQTEAVNYSKNKLLLELARKVDKMSCRASDKIIIVGRDMQRTLINRFKGKKVPSNEIINNWIDEKNIYPIDKDHTKIKEFKDKYSLNDKFIIMYSGNIGLYYDLENIIKVIGKFSHRDDVVFAFVGDGTMKNTLKQYVEENSLKNVKFIPYQNKEDLIYSLNAGDVHLVTNQKGIKGISVPSKIYGVLAVGKPILGVLEKDSEAELIIRNCNCGIVVEPQDYKGIELALNKILDEKDNMQTLGKKGRTYLEENLTKDMSIRKYIDILSRL
ncbi:glycosyl transferase family 1 [Clostridium sulfidigenes]|uniref:Glycosyl transferase family 1 n=1 Tax=Clostridium sulfidigenes TaxID=318464 RepID=A0A084JA24_9CLOT|nr:glycosyltransferase family 4 protein [Clostridium sulfidigenes]KEZ85808.1 glycosyl transferase family 1 [Clostridium sulfidigenes]